MVNKDFNYELIARYIAGECSEREANYIESRIEEDPELEMLIQEFQLIWETKTKILHSWNIDETWNRISQKVEQLQNPQKFLKKRLEEVTQTQNPESSRIYWIIRVAAVLLVAGLTGLFAVLYFENSDEERQALMREVITEKGQRSEIHLSEGSKILLNADSRLTIPVEFDTDTRSVHLAGEAYFEIARNESKPFSVYTEDAVIRILGTDFNVNAYSEENIFVAVAEGKVAVRFAESLGVADEAIIEKGEGVRLKSGEDKGLIVKQKVDLESHLGWLHYRYSFEDVPLEEAVQNLERWYGIDIKFEESEIGKLNISANFEGESVEEVLRILKLALDLEYEKNGHEVIFFHSDVDR